MILLGGAGKEAGEDKRRLFHCVVQDVHDLTVVKSNLRHIFPWQCSRRRAIWTKKVSSFSSISGRAVINEENKRPSSL